MYSLIIVAEVPTPHAYTVTGDEETIRAKFEELAKGEAVRYVGIVNELGQLFNEYSALAGEIN